MTARVAAQGRKIVACSVAPSSTTIVTLRIGKTAFNNPRFLLLSLGGSKKAR